MALSDYEKQVLEELEASFAADTTRQGASTQRAAQDFSVAAQGRLDGESDVYVFSIRRLAVGAGVSLNGFAVLLYSVSLGYSSVSIALGVASFILVVLGVYSAVTRVKGNPAAGWGRVNPFTRPLGSDGRGNRDTSGNGIAARWQRFMEDQQRRWEDRDR